MEKLVLYFKESYEELAHKVTWPSWSNLQSTTILVLVATIIITLVIFLLDTLSQGLMAQVYKFLQAM